MLVHLNEGHNESGVAQHLYTWKGCFNFRDMFVSQGM
jgi:hypothetical protein